MPWPVAVVIVLALGACVLWIVWAAKRVRGTRVLAAVCTFLAVCLTIVTWAYPRIGSDGAGSTQAPTTQTPDTPATTTTITDGPSVLPTPASPFGNVLESHTPDDAATAVTFRDWNPSADADLRDDSYADQPGVSKYLSFSNTFNALGANGSDSDRIVSDVHLPLADGSAFGSEGMSFVGTIVAERDSQGSTAYADVAVLVDGQEKWRTPTPITGNTVQPATFSIGISETTTEVVVRTSCAPLGAGLSVGLIGLDLVPGSSPSAPAASSPDTDEKYVFVNPFESHSPRDSSAFPVSFGSWDTFTNADLRDDHYEGSDYGQLLLTMSSTFNVLGASDATPIISEIHLPINSKKDVRNLTWTGLIVAEKSTQGSPAYANVQILVDGVEKWRTSEPITANTVAPVSYSVDLTDAKYEVIIKTTCAPLGSGLALGFVDMNLKYGS